MKTGEKTTFQEFFNHFAMKANIEDIVTKVLYEL